MNPLILNSESSVFDLKLQPYPISFKKKNIHTHTIKATYGSHSHWQELKSWCDLNLHFLIAYSANPWLNDFLHGRFPP